MGQRSLDAIIRGLWVERNGSVSPEALERTYVYRLVRGPAEEGPVSNQAFLASYLDHGVWMRAIAASAHVEILERKHTTPTARVASVTALYQLLGLAAEDTLAALVAWAAWACDKSLLMGDLLERSHFRFDRRSGIADKDYCDRIRERLIKPGRRVEIEPRQFVVTMLEKYSRQLPQQFGIPWKREPSVKLVPKREWEEWSRLPRMLCQFLEVVASPKGRVLTACYNKLKHGPQLVVTSFDSMRKARGLEEVSDVTAPHHPVVRVLLDGARTQETPTEAEAGEAVAPYIPDDYENSRRHLMQQLVLDAVQLSNLGTWIYNCEFPHMRRPHQHQDPNVRALYTGLIDELRRIVAHQEEVRKPLGAA